MSLMKMNLRHGFILLAFGACLLLLDLGDPVGATTDHECYRKCDGKPKNCRYTFNVEWYYVLTKACFNCANNVSADCYKPHCVQGDGRQRPIMVANRQLPGPSIDVCENDIVEVEVKNSLTSSEGVSIHWHGLHQVGTPYMDGVASVTQCLVPTHSSFTYRFKASPAGTQFWHSHSGVQRADGLVGNLVIRQKDDKHASLYDFDLKEHEVMLMDWTKEATMDKSMGHHHAGKDNKAGSILINGRGQCANCDGSGENHLLPLETFNVVKGKKYRFRVASNAFLNCPFEVSVMDHKLQMIASDGHEFEPITVSNFIIHAGERYDFVLHADQPVGNYKFMARGLLDCGEKFTKARQGAIVHYDGAPTYNYQQPLPPWNMSGGQDGIQLNSVNVVEDATHQYIASAKALPGSDDALTSAKPDHSFLLYYDFRKINNAPFNHPQYYPISAVERKFHVYTPQLSDISMAFPPSPPLFQFNDLDESIYCNETSLKGKNCATEICSCVHRLVIKKGEVVDLVLLDEGYTYDATHPFHIHGYSFRVMAMKKLGTSLSKETVQNLMKEGKLFDPSPKAPLKDTVMVMDGGYTVMRFRANNPGVWFFHCHLEFHVELGMGLLLQVGTPDEYPTPPHDFPRCGAWKGKYTGGDLSLSLATPVRGGASQLTSLSAMPLLLLLAASALLMT